MAERKRGVSRRAVLRSAALATTALAGERVARAATARALTEAAYVPRPSASQYTFRVSAATLAPDGAAPASAVLVNGTLPAPEVRVREGDVLRIVVDNQLAGAPTSIHNGGSSTYFQIRLDGHPLRITHADGLAVQPVVCDQVLMGMGECYDAEVTIAGRGSYTLHAVAQDGSGQALGVLHTAGAAPTPNRAMPALTGRALRYADLRALAPTTLPDGPLRTFRLPLQGDMARYVWMIDGQVWPKTDPLRIARGDRVQVEMSNETMMWHPMHLHGHFFRLLQGGGELCPLKHTVNVAPRETVRIEFTADNPGNWFFHCHNAYHLEAGMARVFEYQA